MISGSEMVPPMLRICTRTWTRDSHDLFDYETHDSKQLAERHFASSRGLLLLRSDSQITAVTSSAAIDARNNEQDRDHLLTVVSRLPGEYILTPAERNACQSLVPQRLWLVVRALPDKRYALQENDIIKLGRYRLRVKRVIPEGELPNFDVTTLLDFPVPDVKAADGEAGSLQCRICLSEGTEDDQLLCPCECKGSIKYVHAECMRRWIYLRSLKDSKDTDQPLKAALVSESSCELCKAHLPPFVRLEGQLIPLVMMPDLTHPFILLENVTPHATKGLHFISVPHFDSVRVGRGHDASVRIADVSISRNHATISYENGIFYLEDHDSKFGTLVALRRPLTITSNETTAVQVGRSLIEFSIDYTLRFVSGCVEIPVVPGCFKICSAVERMGIVSNTCTPVMSVASINTPISTTPDHVIADTAPSAEGFNHNSFMRSEGACPMIMGIADPLSLRSAGSDGLSMQIGESTPINRAEDNSARHSVYSSSPIFARQSWNAQYNDALSPRFMQGNQMEDISAVSTNDGMAYLRLIMNTPSRHHILRNLRYNTGGVSPNRIISSSDLPYRFPGHQRVQSTSPRSSFEEAGTNQCFLPENAFINVDNVHDVNGNEGSPSSPDANRISFTPMSENVRGVMQWMPLGSNTSPTMQPPK